jgi:hypothetical protein
MESLRLGNLRLGSGKVKLLAYLDGLNFTPKSGVGMLGSFGMGNGGRPGGIESPGMEGTGTVCWILKRTFVAPAGVWMVPLTPTV